MGQGLSKLFTGLDKNRDNRIDRREWGQFGRDPKNKRLVQAARKKPGRQNNADIRRRNALFRMFPGIEPPCDTTCQRKKKTAELKNKLEEKKVNVVTAPNQLFEARKDYLEYTDGKDEYVNKRRKELLAGATKWKTNTHNSWIGQANKMYGSIRAYEDSYDSLSKLGEYYGRISLSNSELKREYELLLSQNSTNDRKAFYEMQGTQDLEWWYVFMKWTYILLVVAFIVASFLTPTTYSWKKRGMFLVVLILYPFIISSVAVTSFATIRGTLSMLPYNTYTHAMGVSFPPENTKVKVGPDPAYQVPELKVKI